MTLSVPWPRGALGALLWLWANALAAATLHYSVDGLDRAQRKNVEAWLGEAPKTVEERAAFLVTARDRVSQGLQALGYYHPDIDLSLDKKAEPWRLAIRVKAGEPVEVNSFSLEIEGDAARDPAFDQWRKDLAFGEGSIFNHGDYEAMKRSLLSLGQRRGYFDAKIAHSRVEVEAGAGTARVELRYESGTRYRFGEVRHSEQSLYSSQLEPLQPFERGDPFELSALQAFQSQLQRTGYFSSVLVQPRIDQATDGEVPLDLELAPAKRHRFEVGVGYSTDTEERVSMVWRTPRVNRYGHSQETRLEYSAINPSGQMIYNIPLTHPLDDVLQLRARLEQNEYGDIDSEQAEAGVRREIRDEAWIYGYSLRYLNERWEIAGDTEDDDYLLPGFSLSHKQRQGPLVNPRSGFSQFYQVEGGSDQAGSDLDLLRAYTKLVYVTSFGATAHRVVGRLEAGAVFVSEGMRDQLAPSLSFFAGGSQSLRGYGYQSIGKEVDYTRDDGTTERLVVGGDRLLIGSLEYQYRFYDDWRGALFVDAGDAFDEGKFEARVGVGVGLHYLTPVGAIKLEVANSVSEADPSWRLHINIGAEF